MKPTTAELDRALLKILDTNRTRFGLSTESLVFRLANVQIKVEDAEAIDRLEYLAGLPKPLVAETRPEINAENRTWKISGAGIKYCNEHGI